MVSFGIDLAPATEKLLNNAIITFGIILSLLAASIAFLAMSIMVLSFLLWKIAQPETQRIVEKKQQ